MRICKPNGGLAPVNIMDMPPAWRNHSPAKLEHVIADDWREYVPSALPNIKSSTWLDDGKRYYQADVVQYTQEELDAQVSAAAAELSALKAQGDAWEQDLERFERRSRAIVAVLIDEINALRGWMTSYKADVAASTSLADLKTRVAALPNLPARTGAQAKSAIAAKVGELQ